MDSDELRPVDIHESIELALNLIRHEYGTRIQVHKDYSELPRIPCHSGKLGQVFMNVLTNAWSGDSRARGHLGSDPSPATGRRSSRSRTTGRDLKGSSESHFRTLLYHQGCRSRDGPGTKHILRHHPAASGHHQGRKRSQSWHSFYHPASTGRARVKAEAGEPQANPSGRRRRGRQSAEAEENLSRRVPRL